MSHLTVKTPDQISDLKMTNLQTGKHPWSPIYLEQSQDLILISSEQSCQQHSEIQTLLKHQPILSHTNIGDKVCFTVTTLTEQQQQTIKKLKSMKDPPSLL